MKTAYNNFWKADIIEPEVSKRLYPATGKRVYPLSYSIDIRGSKHLGYWWSTILERLRRTVSSWMPRFEGRDRSTLDKVRFFHPNSGGGFSVERDKVA